MTLAQRVVLVVALGLVMLVTWLWWYSGTLPADGGWFAYAPNTQTATDTYFVVRERQGEHLAIPLGLIGVWAATSLWLLAPTEPRDAGR